MLGSDAILIHPILEIAIEFTQMENDHNFGVTGNNKNFTNKFSGKHGLWQITRDKTNDA